MGGTPSSLRQGIPEVPPIPGLDGGYLRYPHSPSSGQGGVPHPVLDRGVSHSADGGYPHPDLGWGTPISIMGYPYLSGPGMGYPTVQTWDGVPPSPPASMDRLKLLPSLILWMRAVKNAQTCYMEKHAIPTFAKELKGWWVPELHQNETNFYNFTIFHQQTSCVWICAYLQKILLSLLSQGKLGILIRSEDVYFNLKAVWTIYPNSTRWSKKWHLRCSNVENTQGTKRNTGWSVVPLYFRMQNFRRFLRIASDCSPSPRVDD